MKNFKFWEKRGLLVSGRRDSQGYHYASHPLYFRQKNKEFLIFAKRDKRNRSSIFCLRIRVKEKSIQLLNKAAKLLLAPGKPGCFDWDGLLPCCCVKASIKKNFLYYSGWNNLGNRVWICDTGLALFDANKIKAKRFAVGPIASRSKLHPLFTALTSVIKIKKRKWRAWYNRGLEWKRTRRGEFKCKYGIHLGESNDGIHWKLGTKQIIPFRDSYEHSFGRPCVFFYKNMYHMWFSYRGTSKNPNYRIGYAASKNGVQWQRKDKNFNLMPSKNKKDFDYKAMSYPFVFQKGKSLFLLYAGFEYGKTGFGYAFHSL